MADTTDLKSVEPQNSCRFESDHRHQLETKMKNKKPTYLECLYHLSRDGQVWIGTDGKSPSDFEIFNNELQIYARFGKANLTPNAGRTDGLLPQLVSIIDRFETETLDKDIILK